MTRDSSSMQLHFVSTISIHVYVIFSNDLIFTISQVSLLEGIPPVHQKKKHATTEHNQFRTWAVIPSDVIGGILSAHVGVGKECNKQSTPRHKCGIKRSTSQDLDSLFNNYIGKFKSSLG